MIAPTVISATPTPAFHPIASPRKSTASTMVNGRLSLLIGATRVGAEDGARGRAPAVASIANPQRRRLRADGDVALATAVRSFP